MITWIPINGAQAKSEVNCKCTRTQIGSGNFNSLILAIHELA